MDFVPDKKFYSCRKGDCITFDRSIDGKMNEKSWGYKSKKARTDNQNKKKKEHIHTLMAKKGRYNKKRKKWEIGKTNKIIKIRID